MSQVQRMEPTQSTSAGMAPATTGQVDKPSNSTIYFIYTIKHELPSPNSELEVPSPPLKVLKQTDNQFALNIKESLDRLGKRDISLGIKWDSKHTRAADGSESFVAVVSIRNQEFYSADGALYNSMAEAEQDLAEMIYSELVFPSTVVAKQGAIAVAKQESLEERLAKSDSLTHSLRNARDVSDLTNAARRLSHQESLDQLMRKKYGDNPPQTVLDIRFDLHNELKAEALGYTFALGIVSELETLDIDSARKLILAVKEGLTNALKCRPDREPPNTQGYSPSSQVQEYQLLAQDQHDVNRYISHAKQAIEEINERQINPFGFTFGFSFMGTLKKVKVGRIWKFIASMIYFANSRRQDRSRLEELKHSRTNMEWKFDALPPAPAGRFGAPTTSLPAISYPSVSNNNSDTSLPTTFASNAGASANTPTAITKSVTVTSSREATITPVEASPPATRHTEEPPAHGLNKKDESSAFPSASNVSAKLPNDIAPDTMPYIKQEPKDDDDRGGHGPSTLPSFQRNRADPSVEPSIKEEPQNDGENYSSGSYSTSPFPAMTAAQLNIAQEHDDSGDKIDFSTLPEWPSPTIKAEIRDGGRVIYDSSPDEEDSHDGSGEDEDTSSRASSPATSYSETTESFQPIIEDEDLYDHFGQKKPKVYRID